MNHQGTSLARARIMLESQGRFPGGAVPGDISESWSRSLSFGLDPLGRSENLVLSDTEFTAVRQRNSDLIHFARPELELLFDQIAGSNFMVALGSPEGVVLDTLTDGQFGETDAGRAVIPASVWTEDQRGTNAFGLSLATRRPAQIYGGEHFLRVHRDVSCISAPIFDGRGGLAGVLDASSGSTVRQQHTAALVQMSASNIENSLIRATNDRQIVLQFHPRPEYLGTLSVGMLVLDELFQLHAVNRRGEMFLTGFARLLGERFDTIFEQRFQDVAQRLLQGETLRLRDRMGSGVSVRCVANRASFAFAGRMAPGALVPAAPGHDAVVNPFRDVVLEDATLREALAMLPDAARKGRPICLIGETGTGKEVYARLAHAAARRGKPFVAVDAATLAATDAVTTFLGRTDGAGLLAEAAGGSLYVGEIAALSATLQVVLARVLEQGEYRHPVTGILIKTDILFLCGSTLPLRDAALVPQLWYRLTECSVVLPPLRTRTDLVALATRFARTARPDAGLDPGIGAVLASHDWPGNLDELRAVMTSAALLCAQGQVAVADLHGLVPDLPRTASFAATCQHCAGIVWKEEQCRAIRGAVQRHGGNVTHAAQDMGMSRTTVYRHLATEMPLATSHSGR